MRGNEAVHLVSCLHAHLRQPFLNLMLVLSDPGSPGWIAALLVAPSMLVVKHLLSTQALADRLADGL
jgi:hypothetical protein